MAQQNPYSSFADDAGGEIPFLRFKLGVMMFLEFLIWGAWLPLIFGYLPSLGFSATQQSWVLNAFALASLTGMFFSNQFADRNFAAEKFLSFSHLIGGLAIMGLAWTKDFWPFFGLMLLHSLFYVPTISITNSIAFANLKNPQRDFGPVRLWGTIGWIAASWPFVFLLVDWAKVNATPHNGVVEWLGLVFGTPLTGEALKQATTWTFITSGIASLLLAAFSLTLPHTPPKPAKAGEDSLAFLSAIKLLKLPFVCVLFVVTFFDACVHQCYFIWTNNYLQSVGIPANWVMPVMSIGQVAEIGTMAFLGYCLKGLGWRKIMIIGILGHAVRFAVFSLAPFPGVAIAVNLLHGICYAFFFATVYIFVDEFFPKDVRTSAQGLFNFLILGFGPFVANFIWPQIGEYCREDVPSQRFGNTVIVERAEKYVDIRGKITMNSPPPDQAAAERTEAKTPPPIEVRVTLADPETQKVLQTIKVKPDDKGEWKSGEVFIGNQASAKLEIAAKAYETPAADAKEIKDDALPAAADVTTKIDLLTRVNYFKLFLYPVAMAVFAALLLFLFFHPPAKATNPDDVVPVLPH